MSSALLIPPSQSLVEAILTHLASADGDYSRNLVLFPGKRPGNFLRKLIAGQERRSFVPPRLMSIDEFVMFIVRERLGIQFRQVGALDAVALLFDIHTTMPERFGGDHIRTLDAFLPLGIQLFGELEELALANCSPSHVRSVVGRISYGKVHLLPALYEQFYAVLESQRLLTRAVAYRRAMGGFHPEHLREFEKTIVAGFFGLTVSERMLFTRIAELDSATFLFHRAKGIKDVVASIGLKCESSPVAESTPTISFYRSPDMHGQVFALTAEMKRLLSTGHGPSDETVVVLPSAEMLFPMYHQTLALMQEDHYNISLDYDVVRTPVYSFLDLLLKLHESSYENRMYVPDYVKFLMHPYTKNIRFGGKAEATRMLVHAIEQHFLANKSKTYVLLEELEQQTELFAEVADAISTDEVRLTAEDVAGHLRRIHDATIRPLGSCSTIRDAAAKCIVVIGFIDDESTARLHPFFHPFVRRLTETLDELGRSLLAERSFKDQSSYVRFLRSALSETEVHFAGTPLRGLQVLGFLETRNLKFQRVFILDANDNVLPGGRKQWQQILPNNVRQNLGLESTRDRERLSEYYFDVLVRGAEEVHIFYTEGGGRERSRFVEKLLWDRQRTESKGATVPDDREYVWPISYAMSLENRQPTPVVKSEDVVRMLKHFRYSASALDTYLQCRLRFYYAYVLKLREKEEVSGELQQSEIGTLVHAVLMEFFRPFIGTSLRADALKVETLRSILDAKLHDKFGDVLLGNVAMMRAQIERRLVDVLEHYQLPLVQSIDVVLEDVETVLETPLGDYQFVARVDRIERRGNLFFILDYKTGQDVANLKVQPEKLVLEDRTTWLKAVRSFQLPLYALMYSRLRQKQLDCMRPAIIHLGAAAVDDRIEIPLFKNDEDHAAGNFQILEQLLFKLLEEIVDPHIAFTPTEDLENVCPSCSFSTICGTQWMRTRWGELRSWSR